MTGNKEPLSRESGAQIISFALVQNAYERVRSLIGRSRETRGFEIDPDALSEKCGVFAVWNADRVSRIILEGLSHLQHRGQDSAGIGTMARHMRVYKRRGLAAAVFNEARINSLTGRSGIGHVLYPTAGEGKVRHAQPVHIGDVKLMLAHNGNIPDTSKLEEFLGSHGRKYQGKSDSEMVAEAVAVHMRRGDSLPEAVQKAYPLMNGAFSMVMMSKDSMVAVRDSRGIRPLSMGALNGSTVFSSETCAFTPVGAKFSREVLPGEMVVCDKQGTHFVQIDKKAKQNLDIFEFVYFARPDSKILDRSVGKVRRNFGIELAREVPDLDVDIVIGVPQTGISGANGFSEGMHDLYGKHVPVVEGIIKNQYVNRTFIEPTHAIREQGVKQKLNIVPELVKGKRVALVDDSIVRGTTSKEIVKALFEAGALEVHFLSMSAPIKFPDFYGINTPNQKDLIAANLTEGEVCEFLGATSLHYLSLDGMIAATELPEHMFSTSCFTGRYPIDIGKRAEGIRGLPQAA